MECNTATRRNESLSFAVAWLELEAILLSEISQAQDDKYHHVPVHTCKL